MCFTWVQRKTQVDIHELGHSLPRILSGHIFVCTTLKTSIISNCHHFSLSSLFRPSPGIPKAQTVNCRHGNGIRWPCLSEGQLIAWVVPPQSLWSGQSTGSVKTRECKACPLSSYANACVLLVWLLASCVLCHSFLDILFLCLIFLLSRCLCSLSSILWFTMTPIVYILSKMTVQYSSRPFRKF